MRRLPGLLIDSSPVLVLAVIAAAGSFTHIRDTANEHGQHGWMAWAVAVCIDLTCVMAARERQRDKRVGRITPRLSWPTCVLIGGVLLSLAANLAQAEPVVWGWVMAATPAAAFLVAVSMLERRAAHGSSVLVEPQERHTADGLGAEPSSAVAEHLSAGDQPAASPAPVGPASDLQRPEIPAHTPTGASSAPAAAGSGTSGSGGTPGPSPALVNYARQIAEAHRAQHGKPITRDQLRTRLKIGTDLASTLLREVRTEPA
ncbi:DUF2637 domain-containing protein [Actinomadura graeca]|uniref:DUF2637 domain-containing protein n=1 Tax=Actinomadura graeca TaxID=2750812 RepID=A0ABX8R7E3_9ACTN|nr:DUF2637 domain-containing protein [Actinomadura graeca]QXJ27001.1 DUF2637 domain-containing protein [Actinomadura graeca]